MHYRVSDARPECLSGEATLDRGQWADPSVCRFVGVWHCIKGEIAEGMDMGSSDWYTTRLNQVLYYHLVFDVSLEGEYVNFASFPQPGLNVYRNDLKLNMQGYKIVFDRTYAS